MTHMAGYLSPGLCSVVEACALEVDPAWAPVVGNCRLWAGPRKASLVPALDRYSGPAPPELRQHAAATSKPSVTSAFRSRVMQIFVKRAAGGPHACGGHSAGALQLSQCPGTRGSPAAPVANGCELPTMGGSEESLARSCPWSAYGTVPPG